jgi:hypothetical protein
MREVAAQVVRWQPAETASGFQAGRVQVMI